jgi:DnaJ-domain-containing protein 1
MSIPERLWRVVKGQVALATDRLEGWDSQRAEAAAYDELAEALRSAPLTLPRPAQGEGRLPAPAPPQPGGQRDPLEACYALLNVEPGGDLGTVEAAYTARMAEVNPELSAAGSPERAALEARRAAIQAAYDKLRDVLNPTETRFERLEF